MTKNYYIYIMTNKKDGVIYIGVTNSLLRRVWEHKNKIVKGFTDKYNLDRLVYCEHYLDINYAIKREKELKKWRRQWKINLIEKENPNWEDLYIRMTK